MMIPVIEVELAAMTLPNANINKPIKIIGLRPKRSDNIPKGICKLAWVSP